MPKLGWNRLAAMIAGAIAILLVAIVGGRWAIGWAQEAAQNRMYALGLVQLSESDPFQAVGVLLPGESPWRTAPADQSIGVDFAAAKDLPELRRCVARLGKCAMVSFDYPRPIHDPDVKAILDAAQPRTVIVTGGSISQGLIAALVATKSVVTLNVNGALFEPLALAPLANDRTLESANVTAATLDAASLADLMRAGGLAKLTLRDVRFDLSADWNLVSSPRLTLLMLAGSTAPPPRSGEWIAGMTGLTHLHLRGVDPASFAPESLAGLTRLLQLGLERSPVDDAWLARLPTLPRLEYLNLGAAPVSVSALEALLERQPALARVATTDCRFQPGELAALRAKRPNLVFDVAPCPPEMEPSRERGR